MPLTIRNKDRLFAKLRRLLPAVKDELEKAGQKSAEEMVGIARQFAPVASGALRDSIVATPSGQMPPAYSQGGAAVPEGGVAVSAGNAKVRYAHLVEFGTKSHPQGGQFAGAQHPGTPAAPFFWPSWRLLNKKHRGRMGRALTTAAKKVGKS